jgi:hypothetical protein
MSMEEISRREYRQFFSTLGFDEDPFQYTNADEEERLTDYFVAPPYFPSVFGDPDHPKTFVVFAPRGGGKSAQRRIIENTCVINRVLSITYDQFEFPDIKNPSDVTLYYHLRNIIRFALMGLLVTLNDNPYLKDNLTNQDQEIFVRLAKEYLSDTSELALKQSLNSLKSIKDKVHDFWNEWLPLINVGLSALLKKLVGSDVGSLDKYSGAGSDKSPYQKYNLELVISLAQKLGYRSIYVLVDRVDEAELTGNNTNSSFQLIQSMLRDLELLEMKGIGFKFFLWDQLEPFYKDIARTDRIRQETLEWDDEMLLRMWEKRLLAFSKGKVSCLDQVSDPLNPIVDMLSVIFANQSPRDMIRVGAQIISEQQEINISSGKISNLAVFRGIEKFCSKRSVEILTPNTLNDLRKIQQVDFTIPYLANIIFREAQATTRNRIMRWRREGAIVDVEKIDNPNPEQKAQVKLMALQDIRVAKVIHSDIDVLNFLKLKYKKCPYCNTNLLRDWGDEDSGTRCHACQAEVTSDEDQKSWDHWKQRQLAVEFRSRYRKQIKDTAQLKLFDENSSRPDDSDD